MPETLAKKVALYFKAYRRYLQEHNLDDDSNSLTVEDLIEFVDSQIDEEDLHRYITED